MSDKDDFVIGFIIGFVFVVGCVLGAIVGWTTTASLMQREAIKLGHASYVVDKNGFARFAWNQSEEILKENK